MSRTTLCCGLCLLAIACSSPRPVTRAIVLRSLVQQIAVVDTRALVTAQAALTSQLSELAHAPSDATLRAAQSAWKRALLCWERVHAFRLGPVIESRALMRAMFWPIRTDVLETLLHDASPLDPARIDKLGIDTRGMFALEWLLFGPPSPRLGNATPEGARARAVASALGDNVERYARATLEQLGDGERLAASLNREEQQSVSRFVDMTIVTVETLTTERLASALQLTAAERMRPRPQRGGVSGMSSALVLAQLTATAQLYLGNDAKGLSNLVQAAAPAIDVHLRTLFQVALERVRALDGPLEVVTQRERWRVEQAHAAVKELERALKSELTSALGVTLTFESSDED